MSTKVLNDRYTVCKAKDLNNATIGKLNTNIYVSV